MRSKSKSRVGRSMAARSNMAIKMKDPSTGIELIFDTPQEAVEYMALRSGAAPAGAALAGVAPAAQKPIVEVEPPAETIDLSALSSILSRSTASAQQSAPTASALPPRKQPVMPPAESASAAPVTRAPRSGLDAFYDIRPVFGPLQLKYVGMADMLGGLRAYFPRLSAKLRKDMDAAKRAAKSAGKELSKEEENQYYLRSDRALRFAGVDEKKLDEFYAFMHNAHPKMFFEVTDARGKKTGQIRLDRPEKDKVAEKLTTKLKRQPTDDELKAALAEAQVKFFSQGVQTARDWMMDNEIREPSLELSLENPRRRRARANFYDRNQPDEFEVPCAVCSRTAPPDLMREGLCPICWDKHEAKMREAYRQYHEEFGSSRASFLDQPGVELKPSVKEPEAEQKGWRWPWAKKNPSYSIPSDFPQDLWQWGPKPTHAHWTSYPTYAYQQFYRDNPRRTVAKARKNEGDMTSKLPSWVRAPKIVSPIDVPTSSSEAKAIPWKYATNAGPFLPQMFPYGQGGRPYVYGALNNPGRRGGFTPMERDSLPTWYFLKPSGRGWPAGDPRKGARDDMHALEVIRYMNRGFGNRSEYPGLIRELARRYSPEDTDNRQIWTAYQRAIEGIQDKAHGRMPSVAELRRMH